MHETRIAMDLADTVIEVAQREHLSRVTRVNLQFGQMVQLVPDIFRFAFEEATRGTIAGNSEVDLEIVPVRLRCNNCLKDHDIDTMVFRCAFCNSADISITQGKEMIIKSIEGD